MRARGSVTREPLSIVARLMHTADSVRCPYPPAVAACDSFLSNTGGT